MQTSAARDTAETRRAPEQGRDEQLVRQRLRMVLLTAASYAADTLILGLLVLIGSQSLPWWAPIAHGLTALAVCLVFFVVFKAGLHQRFKENYLTIPQIAVAAAVQVVFAHLLPEMALIFLLQIFVIMAFGGLRLDLRQILLGWVIACAGVVAVLMVTPIRIGWPHTTSAETLISCAAICLALLRMAWIGAYSYELRQGIHLRALETEAMMRQIERLATRDELTGVLNRRSLQILLEEQLELAERGGQGFCVSMLDLDHFKVVNDSHGHLVGDAVLKAFAGLAERTLRNHERIGRYGGEEFLATINTATVASAMPAVERLRAAAEAHHWAAFVPGLQVTVSAGVAAYHRGDSAASLLKRADDALYRAKRSGRNRVVAES